MFSELIFTARHTRPKKMAMATVFKAEPARLARAESSIELATKHVSSGSISSVTSTTASTASMTEDRSDLLSAEQYKLIQNIYGALHPHLESFSEGKQLVDFVNERRKKPHSVFIKLCAIELYRRLPCEAWPNYINMAGKDAIKTYANFMQLGWPLDKDRKEIVKPEVFESLNAMLMDLHPKLDAHHEASFGAPGI